MQVLLECLRLLITPFVSSNFFRHINKMYWLLSVVECEGYLYQQMFHLSDKPCHMIVRQSIRSTIYIILE
jgi:predicted transposase YdaD